jgi:hypothetical protein
MKILNSTRLITAIFVYLLIHVYLRSVLGLALDLFHGGERKSFKVEDQDVRQFTKFCFYFGFRRVTTFFALIFVI